MDHCEFRKSCICFKCEIDICNKTIVRENSINNKVRQHYLSRSNNSSGSLDEST